MLHFTIPENQFDETKQPETKEGIFCDTSERFEIALAFSGKNTGFGSIKAGKNWIRSFGLHYHPLGQMENYGIDREALHFKDVAVLQEKDQFCVTGWTRLVKGDTWCEVKLLKRKAQVDLFLRIENFGPEIPLALALFISSDRIQVGKEEMHSQTLSRFKGKTGPVSCRSGGECLQITPHSSDTMQIIPLAGKNHFWGAGFLVAFDIKDFTTRFHINFS